MPLSQLLNRVQAALAGIYISAAVAAAFALSASNEKGSAVVLFACIAPLAAFSAWRAAAVSRKQGSTPAIGRYSPLSCGRFVSTASTTRARSPLRGLLS